MHLLPDRRAFVEAAYQGFTYYMSKKSRIERLDVSIVKTDPDIIKYFNRFIGRLENKMKWGNKISYLGVLVYAPNNNHIHLYWKKPYIPLPVMRQLWIDVTGNQSNLRNKTLFSDKKHITDEDEQNDIEYVADQSDHHLNFNNIPSECSFFRSEYWGMPLQRNKSIEKRVFIQYEESYMIPNAKTGLNEFCSKEVFEDYMKNNISHSGDEI